MPDKQNHKIRIVTAGSLFDGHDATINIMRRIMQSKGAEIIHLGHNRSVHEIVECAIEEDAKGIAVTSYQGGHLEFFKYMKDLLAENGSGHIKIFGGGGGTILPTEIDELHAYGITRIYSPDDGRKMGLEGMIEDVVNRCKEDKSTLKDSLKAPSGNGQSKYILGEWHDIKTVARAITLTESKETPDWLQSKNISEKKQPVLGITGTGGAGKSSVTDEMVRRFLTTYVDKTIAVISVDPSRKKTGGALLGDRIRMNSIHHPRAYMRSLATRESDKAISLHIQEAIDICKAAAFDFIILETSGIGQSDTAIVDYCDIALYVMTPEYGAASQLEKINMLDYADLICINKFDKAGALDALHDVRKQYKRNHLLFTAKDETLPVVGTIAAQFNDAGSNELFDKLMEIAEKKTGTVFGKNSFGMPMGPSFMEPEQKKSVPKEPVHSETTSHSQIIPPKRVRYLSEIAESNREYDELVKEQAAIASRLYQLNGALELVPEVESIKEHVKRLEDQLTPVSRKLLQKWPEKQKAYEADFYEYNVRN